MNEMMVRNWNTMVNPEDTVYILGDMFMGKRVESMAYTERLNGTKLLVPGNHDACHPMHKKSEKAAKQFAEVSIEVLDPQIELTFGRRTFDVCHFPYEGDSESEDRYQSWRPTDRGRWLLHGHIHDLWKVKGNMINLGGDVWNFLPVSEQLITDLIDNPDDPRWEKADPSNVNPDFVP